MAIDTDISTLSQTAALNGPTGSDPVSSGDDALRYHGSFIAKLRDGVGFAAGGVIAGLGYTPVQQGGGTGQVTNKLYIGWTASSKIGFQVDATNYGTTWPIDISGNAATATSATTATNATNATNATSAANATVAASCSGNSATATTAASCSGNSATATTASNSNALGGVAASGWAQRSPGNCVAVEGPRNTGVNGRAIPNTDNRVNWFAISGPDLIVEIDGTTYAIQKSVSDERLKTNIRPTETDSAAEIGALAFKSFDFNDLDPLMAGQSRKVGITAQQAESINPNWVLNSTTYKQLNMESMLMSTMHALKQALARIDALEAR